MKWFLSFKFSGENIDELEPILTAIHKKLLDAWLSEVFCSLFLEDFFNNKWRSTQERYDFCLEHMHDKHIIVCLIKSHEKSHGMVGERDKALLYKQPILLLIKEWLEEHHPEFVQSAYRTITFKAIDNLLETLAVLDIQAMMYSHHKE